MGYLSRSIEKQLQASLKCGKSILLLGARQTGKTTLLKHLKLSDISYTLLDPEIRLRFERSTKLLSQEILAYKRLNSSNHLPLVVIDEIQKVPQLMDEIQLLIDNREAQFIITGSSVRKLRRHAQFNLLPGRVINCHLDPLSLLELSKPLPNLTDLLLYGSLPGIYLEEDLTTKQIDLEAYVTNYLEEEIRAEALVRQLGSFARFLELAALEAGNQINVNKLSRELGIGRHTIAEYFRLLEDCLIAEKIEPITDITTRRRLTKAPKYLFFDMGIRRIAALEGIQLSVKRMAGLFKQFIGLELLRHLRSLTIPNIKLRYWRDHAGPEIDYILESNRQYLPIEVKWTEFPTPRDAKHLIKFMQEYKCIKPAYIVCRCAKPLLLEQDILALPWQELDSIFKQF
jgi:predicted AAA+ superfamily ATPase